ncbi:MAG: 4Fe-4S binding protein [Promethearchaeota archaeon]
MSDRNKRSKWKFNFKKHKITIIRRTIQIIVLLGINSIAISTIFGWNTSGIEPLFRFLPFISAPRSNLSNSAGFIELIFGSFFNRVFPFLIIGLLVLVSIFFGRATCGWLCPSGLLQDITCWVGEVTNQSRNTGTSIHEFLGKIKNYVVLLLFVILLPAVFAITDEFYNEYTGVVLGEFGRNPLGFWSLDEFLTVFIPDFIVNTTQGNLESFFNWIHIVQFVFYFVVIILSFYFPRFYCKYLCPYAAISKPIAKYAAIHLSRNPAKCVGRKECGLCEAICPMQIRILDESYAKISGGGECILCGRCIEACPHDAIELSLFGGKD